MEEGGGIERSTYLDLYEEYQEGHVPGATFVSWLRDGIDEAAGPPAQLTLDGDAFAAAMEEKGVGTEQPVVVYDRGDNLLAPRIWWALTLHGHGEVRTCSHPQRSVVGMPGSAGSNGDGLGCMGEQGRRVGKDGG